MEELVVYKEPASALAETYRVLCTNLQATLGEKKIVEVVGIGDASNTNKVVGNLGIALAQAGKKVLIIDCNLRNPKQHELFGLPNRGLTDCVPNGESYTTLLQETKQVNLFVLVAGAMVDNPAETLSSKAMQNLLQDVKEAYDVILLDAPPVTVVYDAIALGSKTDGVLLVIINKKDKAEEAQKVKEMFVQAKVNILGCILDKA